MQASTKKRGRKWDAHENITLTQKKEQAMKVRTKQRVIFFLIAFFITAGLALSSYAKQGSKGQKTTQILRIPHKHEKASN